MPRGAYDEFRKEFEALIEKNEVSKQEFLSMAKMAIKTYRQQPEKREEIARSMAGLWFSDEEVEEGSSIDEIGGYFADLELPDAHIDIKGFESVEDKWDALAEKIDQAIIDSQKSG